MAEIRKWLRDQELWQKERSLATFREQFWAKQLNLEWYKSGLWKNEYDQEMPHSHTNPQHQVDETSEQRQTMDTVPDQQGYPHHKARAKHQTPTRNGYNRKSITMNTGDRATVEKLVLGNIQCCSLLKLKCCQEQYDRRQDFLPFSRGRISAPFTIENSHPFSHYHVCFPN